jgi:hypothetical protein
VSSILPKNELENVNFCPKYPTGAEMFRGFLGRIEINKKPFSSKNKA